MITKDNEIKIATFAAIIMDNHYGPITMEEAIDQAHHKWCKDKAAESSSDWGPHTPPTDINWYAIWKRMPKHRNCPLVIRVSDKNPEFTGLYCEKHDKLIQWVNEYQIYWLMRPHSLGIKNESGTKGLYPL